jgi:hypothetical protein
MKQEVKKSVLFVGILKVKVRRERETFKEKGKLKIE